MEQTILKEAINEEYNEEEEAQAAVNVWKYVFGFTEMAVVKCAVELGIAEVLERNGGSMTISELSSALGCPQPHLYRIMRFLAHRRIFKQTKTTQGTFCYTQTPLSRQLVRMTPFILLESSPVMLAPWLSLSSRVRGGKGNDAPFQVAHGEDLWSYAANHPSHSKLFNDAMACDISFAVPQIIKECPGLFDGISTVVDVGGGDGSTLSMLVEAFPWIRGINYDLPHVVSNASIPSSDRIEHVGGDMFDNIPKADAVFLKWVLHDWDDDECIQILNKCKEAITKEKAGKVIIVDAVIEEETEDKLEDARLMCDMAMMAHTINGKERTLKEWRHILHKAGFNHFNVKSIQAVQSVIEASLSVNSLNMYLSVKVLI